VKLMKRSSPYIESACWWKPRPLRLITVLTSVKSGGQSKLHDLILSVWTGETLVPAATMPFAGEPDEVAELELYVRENTTGRRGPIIDVRPEQLFVVEFDGVDHSERHRSGIALRNARIVRRCRELTASEVGKLEELKRFAATHS